MGNWDFDGDEAFFFIVAALIAFAGAIAWYVRIARFSHLGQTHHTRTLLAMTPLLASLGLLVVLRCWSDPKYVANQWDYFLLFLAGGVAWMWLIGGALPLFGISPRDDALERRNPAAAIVVAGALLGAMAIYAQSNIGSGPTIWTTIAPAFVATAVWLAAWLVVELCTRISESITVDRDVASACRYAGWLVAIGLVLGRAMAGDWASWYETFATFFDVATTIVTIETVLAVAAHIYFKPRPGRRQRSIVQAGVVPAVILIVISLAYIVYLGKPDIGVHVVTYEQYMGEKK
jgi:uncharacterized membrane protein YjfL (UPF0719 family)